MGVLPSFSWERSHPYSGLRLAGRAWLSTWTLILACTTCLDRVGALCPRPSFLLHPTAESPKVPGTYGTNILGRTACKHATTVGPIRFNSVGLSLFVSPFLFRSCTFFSVGLYLRPARSTYSLENDRSSVDFTRGGFSQLYAVLSASLFFYPAFMQPDEGSSSRISFHLLSNYHWFHSILSRNLNALFG